MRIAHLTRTLLEEHHGRIAELAAAFVERADPGHLDGYSAEDYVRLFEVSVVLRAQIGTWLLLDGERTVGFAMVMLGPSLQASRTEAQGLALYVEPEVGHRETLVPQLAEAAEEWAREHGAFRLILGSQHPLPTVWNRLGYAPAATLYMKEL